VRVSYGFKRENLFILIGRRPKKNKRADQVIVQILDEAEQDLIDGFNFYEAQAEGLGEYFVDALSRY